MESLHLPRTDAALVDACAAELGVASTSGADADVVEAARLRFAWALAHSVQPTDVERALELLNTCACRPRRALGHGGRSWARRLAAARLTRVAARAGLASDGVKGQRREALYLSAVAHFRAGRLMDARRCAAAALEVAPSCHQSLALKAACEEQLAEDALLAGVGIVGVLAAVGVALLAGSRRSRT